MNNNIKSYDLVGIGVGPANLSLAALLLRIKDAKTCFFESKPQFSWHPHMLFEFSRINVGYHKDLVSLVDPTNPYSFMNYLIQHNKQYEFFNASFDRVLRLEFENYYRWVANSLRNIFFSQPVINLNYKATSDCFIITTSQAVYKSKRVVLGTGIRPKFPAWFNSDLQGERVFHSYDYLAKKRSFRNQKVMIVGGGQSAGEVLAMMLESEDQLPEKIYWVTSKGYPVVLDENPFANEIYTPAFSRFFYTLDARKRLQLNQALKDTSDGIHSALLERIYQRLFYLSATKRLPLELFFLPLSELCGLSTIHSTSAGPCYQAKLKGCIEKTVDHLDSVVFCTGHEYCAPTLLTDLQYYYGDTLHINRDFSIQSVLPNSDSKLFLNNGAKAFYGPADPNLSLLAWRSAVIINAAFEDKIYHLPGGSHMLHWGLAADQPITNLQSVELNE